MILCGARRRKRQNLIVPIEMEIIMGQERPVIALSWSEGIQSFDEMIVRGGGVGAA